MPAVSDRRFQIAILFTVFALYMLTSSREPPWGDARVTYEVAENIVSKGSVEISFPWPIDIERGRNNKYYATMPVLPAVMHLPGLAVRKAIVALSAQSEVLIKPLTAHLAPAFLGALTCLLFFGLCRTLGASQRAASLTTALLALGTTTWVYARYPYSEILQLACFTGFVTHVLRTGQHVSRRNAVVFGVWAGLLVNAKYVLALAVIGGALFVLSRVRKRRDDVLCFLKWAAIAGAPFLVAALAYNYLRWGTITHTGYNAYLGRFFGGSTFFGAWGQLLSPNQSALLYSPALVLGLCAFPAVYRKCRPYLAVLVLCFLPIFLVYSNYHYWSGEYAWGPRFFVFGVAVLLAPAALAVDAMCAWRPRWRRLVLVATFAAGISVQVLGNLFYWDHYIRISMQARNGWLGDPNRRGALIDARGRGICDSCFEDMYPVMWLPPFNPIKGHWWLLKSTVSGDTYQEAQQYAPWRRYTRLTPNVKPGYDRVRVDWWGLLFLKDARQFSVIGWILLLLLLVATLGLATKWIRFHKRAGRAP